MITLDLRLGAEMESAARVAGELPEGWRYADFKPMPKREWKNLCSTLGKAPHDFIFITTATLQSGLRRGQLFVSPGAWKRMELLLAPEASRA